MLRGKNASLEEELNKSRHETFESQHLAHKFEKVQII